jgi:predicted ArsR family transcriptional regulator
MEEITVLDIAQGLGISSDAVRKRLNRLEIKPLRYIGSAAIYSNEAIELIRDHGTRGRPKAVPETSQKPPVVPKKPTPKKNKKP